MTKKSRYSDSILLRKKTNKTLDLNDPSDAREYLAGLESQGGLTYDYLMTSTSLSDADAVRLARDVFMKASASLRKKGVTQ